jgi:hypothetical protein
MKKSETRDLNKGLDDKNYDTKVSVTNTEYDGDGFCVQLESATLLIFSVKKWLTCMSFYFG